MTMTTDYSPVACLVGGSAVRLWGLDGAERLRRQLHAIGVNRIAAEGELPPGATVLLLRGDYLFDDRILREMLAWPGTVLVPEAAGASAVAAYVRPEGVRMAAAALRGEVAPTLVPGATICTPSALSSVYVGKLLKAAPPMLLPIRAEESAALERYLFDGAYKGVTDLVTKWVWPAPARQVVRVCARLGIKPNAVTTASLVLVLAVMALFATGHFGVALLLAWTMTFLDTVDGKLARVTVTSTPAGHYFDHAIDLIHPPFWYMAWAYGIAGGVITELIEGSEVLDLGENSVLGDIPAVGGFKSLLLIIVVAYIAGRLAETSFKRVSSFSMFSWRPVDSYIRLIMARRNPNLLLLTGFLLAGNPRGGLVAVAVWTVFSSLVLWLRVTQGAAARVRRKPLRPWLADLESDRTEVPWYARPFAPDLSMVRRLAQ